MEAVMNKMVALLLFAFLTDCVQGSRCKLPPVCSSPAKKDNGQWWCGGDNKSCFLKCDAGYASLYTSTSCTDGVWTDLAKLECSPSVFLLIDANVEIYHPTIKNVACTKPPKHIGEEWIPEEFWDVLPATFVHNGVVYVCDGGSTKDVCASLNMTVGSREWKSQNISSFDTAVPDLSDSVEIQMYSHSVASTVVMENNLYFIGGYSRTDNFMTPLPLENDPSLTSVPNLPHEGFGQCVVKIAEDSFIVIGGFNNTVESTDVVKYNVTEKTSTMLPSLQEGRTFHGCVMVEEDDKQWIVVSGGHNFTMVCGYSGRCERSVASTERLDLNGGTQWESIGQLNEPRESHRMIETKDGILAIGGYLDKAGPLETREIMDWATLEWKFTHDSDSVFNIKKDLFDTVEVPADIFGCDVSNGTDEK